jgi:small subunit ribosomal protein S8
MVVDPIANLIVSLKNASSAGLKTVTTAHSRIKADILNVLKKSGFIAGVTEEGTGAKRVLVVSLAFVDKKPRIEDFKRVSKFSRRLYVKSADIRPIKNGTGILVVSTPQGVMTGDDAQKAHVGGEALFEIW